MKDRIAIQMGWLAWAAAGVCLALNGITITLDLNLGSSLIGQAFPFNATTFALIGALIAARKGNHPIGWEILGLALAMSLLQFSPVVSGYTLQSSPDPLPVHILFLQYLAWVAVCAMLLGMFLLLLTFPTGRFLSRRWRFLFWIAVLTWGCASLFGILSTRWEISVQGTIRSVSNPLGLIENGALLADKVWNLSLPLLAFGGLALVIRFRRTFGIERQQLKWVAFAGGVFTGTLGLGALLPASSVISDWLDLIVQLSVNMIPIAIAIAIFRYRLWDIDIVVRRTIVYALITGLLALVYFGGVTVFDRLLIEFTGPRSQIATVLSTLVIAALFAPLRRRVQHGVDRRFYRQRYDTERALAAFSAAVRDEVDLTVLSDRLVRVVQDTIQPVKVTLWLQSTGDGKRSLVD